jgi:hypothetical protein
MKQGLCESPHTIPTFLRQEKWGSEKAFLSVRVADRTGSTALAPELFSWWEGTLKASCKLPVLRLGDVAKWSSLD